MQTNQNVMKRYTVFNRYIRGSNQSPQACHALNNLWKNASLSEDNVAVDLFYEWANNHEVEIMLQGGDHEDLVGLYNSLSTIEGVLSASFNEEGLRNACTTVTFVANEAIVAGINYCRGNRLTPFNASLKLSNPNKPDWKFDRDLTLEEIEVIVDVAFLPLAS